MKMTCVDPTAEFERLRALIHYSFLASGLGFVAFAAVTIYFVLKLSRTNKVIRSYPVLLRLRVALSLGSSWEPLVDREHLDDLRNHRRNGRYVLTAYLIWLAFHSGIGVVRKHWLARVVAIGDAAVVDER